MSEMLGRKKDYDVTNTVNMEDPIDVNKCVKSIFKKLFGPKSNYSKVEIVLNDIELLFRGNFEGFHGNDTYYHDLRHTIETFLAMMRMIDGYNRTQKDKISERMTIIGLISGLLHDTGYIRRIGDYYAKSGGKYTRNHIKRSKKFVEEYLPKVGMTDFVKHCKNIISCTGVEVNILKIKFSSKEEKIVGFILGTADFLGQMSDRGYLEKCRKYLYNEFESAGLTKTRNLNGRVVYLYESAEDLLKKTPSFYENVVKKRLKNDFEKVYEYAKNHFGRENFYISEIESNISYLRKVIEKGDFSILKRNV